MGEHAAMVADSQELVRLQARLRRLREASDAAYAAARDSGSDRDTGRAEGLSHAFVLMEGAMPPEWDVTRRLFAWPT